MREKKHAQKGRPKEQVRWSKSVRPARDMAKKTHRNTSGRFAALEKTNAKPRQDWVSALV
ncbi:hypothetical protein LJ655_09400 [Paraburkholderia sp. MMS20-SJTN17]|uniref:Uncharacterized protein n=1 Tax=Paraburkholderia translucens TaxID=2886945 RepID=A0ABS8KBF0_9BURK|nr:hypothetical protein [Paraburkholderia sp. MMS20-SJTN17]MCC8402105.1 hypothetical protein [Paraburkholderia sp. MMS20-SJTN17]